MFAGEQVSDINIGQYLTFLDKSTRKKLDQVYKDVQFDQILLTKNDTTGNYEEPEKPFLETRRNLKLQ